MQARIVYRHAVHETVGTGKIYVLEHAGGELRILRALPTAHVALEVDDYRLARFHVAQAAEPTARERDRLGCNHPFRPLFRFERADTQRADAVRIAKRDHAEIGDLRDDGVGTTAADRKSTRLNSSH